MSLPESVAFLNGGGKMGDLARTMDWSSTVLGSPEGWPLSLKTAVSICLGSKHPIVLWWGKSAYTQFYNDAYISFLSQEKHPAYFGRSGRECWSEIWPVMGPMIEAVFRTGQATWSEDFLYIINRNLPREEAYFTFSYSPIFDDQGEIGGIFCACSETTARVIGERRMRTLRDLSRMEAEAKTVEASCHVAARTLSENRHDIPFALIYLLESDATEAALAAAFGVEIGGAAAPLQIELDDASSEEAAWPLHTVRKTGLDHLIRELAGRRLPGGPWPETAESAFIVPISGPGQVSATGFLVSGLSPRLVADAGYRSFLKLAAGQIGVSIANARAYEDERKRVVALAEIDRAKTVFFSNISHEFRTPLTLMLGPLEDALSSPGLPRRERNLLDVAHRNSLRLLKLVNSLLDFSRIEAGRAEATYLPTDLAVLTADLASNFRSACERVGLRLIIDCAPLNESVYVDRDMWEKIVLNLLSNAFKFTFDGEISVRLREVDRHAELAVRDTGVGIPKRELPRLFERFHRIEGQKSRTEEGSGIGLALVQELVRLHGGMVRVDSEAGDGACFTVSLPLGRAHLPADRMGPNQSLSSTSVRADAYLQEVLHWLPDAPTEGVVSAFEGDARRGGLLTGAHIVVADDNADMRAYIGRLLGQSCDVETVADGEEALAAIRAHRPDLVVTDIMMPRLDGIGLLRAIRSDAALRDIPVIMLSARAGEESRVEGLQAGADDYLVKPFSARELVACVTGRLELLKLRRSFEQRLAADLKAMSSLQQVGSRSVRAGNGFIECLQDVLDAAIEIVGADKGHIQLLDSHSGRLTIAVQRGFEVPFLSFFADAHQRDAPAYSAATQSVERIAVEDVTQSQIFQGKSSLNALLQAGVRAVQSTPLVSDAGNLLGMLSTHFASPHRLSERDSRLIDILARQAADYMERKRGEATMRWSATWSAAQKEAFQAAINGAPLKESLGVLVRAVVGQLRGEGRCAFYITDPSGTGLRHVAGMPESYAGLVDRDSFPGGMAVSTGKPIITPDLAEEPRWKDWRSLAEQYGYRAVWSFPVETSAGKIVGTFAIYHQERREPTSSDYQLAAVLTQAAAIIISRHDEAEERARTVLLLEERAAQLKLVSDELNHRVKNTLATVQAMAQLTMRNTRHPAEFAERFFGRIQSMARAHSLLTDSTWRGADLGDLIRDQLSDGAVDEARLSIVGPTVYLPPQTALHVAMMLHELATNSIKYGALSSPLGLVSIKWGVSADTLGLQWVERGGPPVSAPRRRGFGTTLIEQTANSEGGKAEQLVEPEGMTWQITLILRDASPQEIGVKAKSGAMTLKAPSPDVH